MPRSSLFHSIATRRRFGFNCLSSDSRLVESSVALSDMPVMLPPGRDKLCTRPVANGSPAPKATTVGIPRSEEHTSELQSPDHLVCRLLLEKKNKKNATILQWMH